MLITIRHMDSVCVCVYVLVRPSLVSVLILSYSPALYQPASVKKTKQTNILLKPLYGLPLVAMKTDRV